MTQKAKVYGEALYELAKEQSVTDELLSQLQTLAEIFQQTPQYLSLLAEPSIAKAERRELLEMGFRGRIHDYLLNFLKILCDKNTIRQFAGCVSAYRKRYNEDNGILEVRAVTAVELTPQLKQKLTEKLAATTGKTICLTCRVDPACIGGVRLEMEGQQLDGTVLGRLEQIQLSLRQTVL